MPTTSLVLFCVVLRTPQLCLSVFTGVRGEGEERSGEEGREK